MFDKPLTLQYCLFVCAVPGFIWNRLNMNPRASEDMHASEDPYLHNPFVFESHESLSLSYFMPNLITNSTAAYRNSFSSSINNPLQSAILISSTTSVHQASRSSMIEELSFDDTDSSLLPSCRICQLSAEEANVGPLISPCRCAGTLKFVHQKCLAVSCIRYFCVVHIVS